MKTLKLLLVIVGTIFSITACDDNQNPINEDNLTEINSKVSGSIELPYKAKMHTFPAEDSQSELCSANSPTDFWVQEHQIGSAHATYLGQHTIDLKFCFHVVLNEQGQPDFSGGFGEFTGAQSTIVANNSDQLFTQGNGSKVLPIQDDNYVFEFTQIIDIIGGTGRFENASGQIINYGLVRKDGTGTDHTQEGTIILSR